MTTLAEAAAARLRRDVYCRAGLVDRDGVLVSDSAPVESGTVDFRGEQGEMWAATVHLSHPLWVPRTPDDPLHPLSGLRMRLWWGLDVDGTREEVVVGTLDLEDPEISDDGHLGTSLTLRDPLAQVKRGGYAGQTISVGGMTVTAALDALFEAVAPSRPRRIGDTTETLPAVYEIGARNPGEDWSDIAALAGWRVYTDRDGVIVAGPLGPSAQVVCDWQDGTDSPVVSMVRKVTTSTIVNRVVVASTSPEVTPVIVGIAEDADEGSPTWVGRYGPYELRIESDTIASQAAADNMAATKLGQLMRPSETVEVTVPPRPDLWYRDRVLLARARVGVAGEHQLSAWSLDLAGGLMRVTMMSRSV